MKHVFSVIITLVLLILTARSQTLRLSDILDSIDKLNPSVKVYDAEIQSLDAAAKGAQNWMAPEISTGFWMTPYDANLWKKTDGGATGMGQYMISLQQTFPNKKYNDANEKFMRGMSAVEKENKRATLNELYSTAKENYYSWIIINKKLLVINENDKLLQLIVSNAETRYKNGLGKVSAYYKAKAAQAILEKTRIMLENERLQKRIALNTLMNRDKLVEFSVDTSFALPDYADKTFDSAMLYANRSDIKAIDQNIQLTRLKEDVEKQSLHPQFGVQFAHMFGFGGFPEQFTLMGTMKIPFAKWSSRTSESNIESLKWKAISYENQKQILSNEYSGIAYGIQQDIRSRKRQLVLFENSIIPALRNNYQTMLLAYEQNTEELFGLFDAWESLSSTQIEYLDQLQQLLTLQVNFEKIMELK